MRSSKILSMLNIFEERIKTVLEASLDHLDSETQYELAMRRRLALQQKQSRNWFNMHYLMPTSAFALCLLAGIFMVVNPSNFKMQNKPQRLASHIGDDPVAMLELLTNSEELEVMSDPVFLIWAEEQSVTDKQAEKNAA